MKLVLCIDDEDGQSPIPISRLAPVLEGELPAGEADRTVEVSVSLFSPKEIQELNRQYRGIDEPTDVLSFPIAGKPEGGRDADEAVPQGMPVLPLGDIVICRSETARLHPELPEDEALCLMLAHGFLHLLGWDHDTEERQAAMWDRQDELKARLLSAMEAQPLSRRKEDA